MFSASILLEHSESLYHRQPLSDHLEAIVGSLLLSSHLMYLFALLLFLIILLFLWTLLTNSAPDLSLTVPDFYLSISLTSILGFSLILDISQGSRYHGKIKYKEKEMERASFLLLKDIGRILNTLLIFYI